MVKAIKKKNNELFTPVDPVFRIPDYPVDASFLVERSMKLYHQFQMDRVEWLQRREEFYLQWDDYLSPVHKGLYDGASNFHLPMTEIQCMAMHARILQSIFFVNPPFFIDPHDDLDETRILKIEKYMKYILTRYVNHHKGIFNAIDDFAWDLVTDGMGILSRDWAVVQRRFLDIEDNQDFYSYQPDLQKMFLEDLEESEFADLANEALVKPYKEVMKIRTVFNGPLLIAEDPAFVLFKGMVVDSTDLNRHETVIKVCYLSSNEIIAAKNSEYFDADACDAVLNAPPDRNGTTFSTNRMTRLQYAKDRMTGVKTYNANYVEDKYEFLTVWDTVTPKESKNKQLADRLVYVIHPRTLQLMRWTFLDRISANGKINIHMAHLYRRPRRSIGRGIVESQFTMNEMSDILVNQAIDCGTLANNPMFVYRGNGTFDPEEFRVEPGLGIKADDPNSDLRVLSWNVNPNWAAPIGQLIQSMSSQHSSLGPQASGQVGGAIGPLRSTSGVNALQGQADINLDVIMKRCNLDCISDVFEGLYEDCTARMPDSLKISVVGMDGEPELDENGKPMYETLTKQELRCKVSFGLYANSINMNRQGQLAASQEMAQFLFQRAPMETGVVGANEIYEVCKELLHNMGKIRPDRFIKRPSTAGVLPFEAELYCCVMGTMPPIFLADPDHETKIKQYQDHLDAPLTQLDTQFGIDDKKAATAQQFMKQAQSKHQKFLDTLKQAQAMQNPTGKQTSPTMGLQQGQAPEQQQTNSPQQFQTQQPAQQVARQAPGKTPVPQGGPQEA